MDMSLPFKIWCHVVLLVLAPFPYGFGPAESRAQSVLVFDQLQPPDVPRFSVRTFNIASDDRAKSRLIVELGMVYDALQFIKDKEKGFRADYEAVVTLTDTTGKEVLRESWKGSTFTDDFKKTYSKKLVISASRQFDTVPGTYDFKMELTDLETRRTGSQSGRTRLRNFAEGGFSISGLLFLNSFEFVERVSIIGDQKADESAEDIYAYFELYNLPAGDSSVISYQVLNASDQLVREGTAFVLGQESVARVALTLDRVLAEEPNFRVVVSASYGDKTEQVEQLFRMVLKDHDKNYDIYADLDDSIEKMVYLMSKKDLKKLKGMKGPERLKEFEAFWAARDRTPDTPENEYMIEYYRRIAVASERFKEHIPGWRTDRGMVFVKLGAPQYVDEPYRDRFVDPTSHRRDLQIWHYSSFRRRVIFERFGSEYRLANHNEVFDLLSEDMQM